MTTPICQEWMKNRPIELEYSTTVFFTFKVLKQEMDFKQTTAHVHDTGGVFAKKSCKGHVIPAQFSPNHGPCNRCVTLVVSSLKKSCKGHVISAFCKPWPMYMIAVEMSLLKPSCKGHVTLGEFSARHGTCT